MFYVYTYRDPRPNKNNTVVYVGKGQKNRAYSHWVAKTGFKNKRLKRLLDLLRRSGLEPIIEILCYFENEADAHAKEIELIALYGRADQKKGPLFNNTDGGEGLSNLGEEALAKRSASIKTTYNRPEMRAKCAANWNDPTYRSKCAKGMKEAQTRPEVKKRKQSNTKAGWENEETRRKRTEGIQAAQTPEMVAKRSAANKAGWTEEKRAAFSEKMQKQCQDPEHLERRANAAKEAWARRKANWTEEDSKRKSEIAKATWAKRKGII